MLSQLKIRLDYQGDKLGYNAGSLFQGLLMETIDSAYGKLLHSLSNNPYSQYVYRNQEGTYWILSACNKTAYKEIIQPIIKKDTFYLKKKEKELKVLDRELKMISRTGFIENHLFSQDVKESLILTFRTPTAFKRKNRYVIVPEPGLIFQSLMKKFDDSGEEKIFSEELLEEINASVFISKYKLRSTLFYLEKTKIPACLGHIEMRAETNKEVKNILKLLLAFSQFSGTGIKSSMGMGASLPGGDKDG